MRDAMMPNTELVDSAPHMDERPEYSNVCPEACVARALLCMKEGEYDPQQQHFWLAEAVRWLQRASDGWRKAAGRTPRITDN